MNPELPSIPQPKPATRAEHPLHWTHRLRLRISEWLSPLSESNLVFVDKDELQQLRDASDGMAHLKELHATERGFEIAFKSKPELTHYIAHAFAEIVAKSENYTEMKFEPKTVEHGGKWEYILVTVQKERGKTPHQLRMAAQTEAANWCQRAVELQKQLDAMTAERDRIRDGKWSRIIELEKTVSDVADALDDYAREHSSVESAARAAVADQAKWREEAFRLRDKLAACQRTNGELALLIDLDRLHGNSDYSATQVVQFIGTMTKAGDDEAGEPVVIIHSDRASLRDLPTLPLFKKAVFIVRPLLEPLPKIPQHQTGYDKAALASGSPQGQAQP